MKDDSKEARGFLFTKDGDRKCQICGSVVENVPYPHMHLNEAGEIIKSDEHWSTSFLMTLWSL